MRRLTLLLPVALAGSLALAGCSGGSPSGQSAGKSASSALTTQRAAHDEDKPGKVSPGAVVDGMHYVQLFNTVDPVLARLTQDDLAGTVPAAGDLQNAVGSLRQFAAQARKLPASGNARNTLDRLATASSTLAGQLDTLATKGSKYSDAATLTAALTGYKSAAAAARQAAGLPAMVASSKPQPDTGP